MYEPTQIHIQHTRTLETEIKRLARKYQVPEQRAKRIIYCESGNQPQAHRLNTNGTEDFSYWQINNHYWEAKLKEKGWDIKNPQQNLEAGFYLYKTYGESLWSWSAYCWA